MAQDAGVEGGGDPCQGTLTFGDWVEGGKAHRRLKDNGEAGGYKDRVMSYRPSEERLWVTVMPLVRRGWTGKGPSGEGGSGGGFHRTGGP